MKKNRNTKDRVFTIGLVVVTSIILIFFLIPIVEAVRDSFINCPRDLRVVFGRFFPEGYTINHYRCFFESGFFTKNILGSVQRTILGTLISTVCTFMLAYILSIKKFLFRKSFTKFWVFSMYLQVGIIPTFLLYNRLCIRDSILVFILPGAVNVFNMLIIKTYMEKIPSSLIESAEIDGAGYLSKLFRIMVPLCKPVIAVTAVSAATSQWNSFFDARFYPAHRIKFNLITTLVKDLMMVRVMDGSTVFGWNGNMIHKYSINSVIFVLSAIVALAVVLIFGKDIEKNMITGSVKE